jgi:hypothetical protein
MPQSSAPTTEGRGLTNRTSTKVKLAIAPTAENANEPSPPADRSPVTTGAMEGKSVSSTNHYETADLETAVELLRVVRWADADDDTLRAAAAGIAVLRRALAEQRTQGLLAPLTWRRRTPCRR